MINKYRLFDLPLISVDQENSAKHTDDQIVCNYITITYLAGLDGTNQE